LKAAEEILLNNSSNLSAISFNKSSSFLEISSPEILDREKVYLISFLLSIEDPPAPNVRVRLITSYDAGNKPYAGWGFAIKNFNTSIRPEIYWRGSGGKGGWYPFSPIDLSSKSNFFIVFKPRSFISLFSKSSSAELRFLGAYDISSIKLDSFSGDIRLGNASVGKRAFLGSLGLFLYAQTNLSANRSDIKNFLNDGVLGIVNSNFLERVFSWIPLRKDDKHFLKKEGSISWVSLRAIK
jgi:hypothetical protein